MSFDYIRHCKWNYERSFDEWEKTPKWKLVSRWKRKKVWRFYLWQMIDAIQFDSKRVL